MAYFILIFGVFCCSTAVIFLKESTIDPAALSAYRLLIASIILYPLLYRTAKRVPTPVMKNWIQRIWPPAIFLAFHFVTWNMGARLTPSANASLIVNMVPVVMPFLLWGILQEHLNRPEILGTILAILGVTYLGFSDFNLSREYAWGDLTCFVSMLFYAFYLLHARKNKDLPSIYFYVVPVYAMAGVICLIATVLFDLLGGSPNWTGNQGAKEWIPVLGLALIPTIFGHSIINRSLKIIRGQAVVILNLGQFIFAGVMGFFILNEIPHPSFYIASSLVVAGAIIVIRFGHSMPSKRRADPS